MGQTFFRFAMTFVFTAAAKAVVPAICPLGPGVLLHRVSPAPVFAAPVP